MSKKLKAQSEWSAMDCLMAFKNDWPQFFDDSDDEVNGADLVDYISQWSDRWAKAIKCEVHNFHRKGKGIHLHCIHCGIAERDT